MARAEHGHHGGVAVCFECFLFFWLFFVFCFLFLSDLFEFLSSACLSVCLVFVCECVGKGSMRTLTKKRKRKKPLKNKIGQKPKEKTSHLLGKYSSCSTSLG